MKILLVSDREEPYIWDYFDRERFKDIELVLSCGDLKAEYLSFIVTMIQAPLYYVPGNHNKNYLTNPPEYSADEPDEVSVTRLVYSETRSEYKKPVILKHKACSVVNRSKERGLGIKDVIFEDMQYNALRDGNSPYFYSPSNFTSVSEIDLEAWQKCYEIAESILKEGAPYKTTHTFLEKLEDKNQSIPNWVNTLTPVANIKTVDGKGLYHFLTELA